MLCKCGCANGQELITLTADPEPCTLEEGMHRWVSYTEKHALARRFEAAAFTAKILEMGFIPALQKVSWLAPSGYFSLLLRRFELCLCTCLCATNTNILPAQYTGAEESGQNGT